MRTHVVSIGGFLLGMSVAIVVLGVLTLDVSAQQARATARTSATVVYLYYDDAGGHVAADLEWFDAGGVRHVTLVQVGNDREVVPGAGLAIRYAPDNPDGLVFPGADDEFPPPGDWVLRTVLGLLVALPALLLLLGARLLLNLRAARAPAAAWRAAPLLLTHRNSNATWYAGYLRLTEVPAGGGPARRYLQRVYWDPALDRMRPRKQRQYGEQVQAHVGGWPFRRAVVVLDDGTRVWPAGRLRRRRPWRWNEEPRPSYGRRRPRPGGGLIAAMAATVGIGSFALYGPAVGIAAAGVGVAILHYIWGWYGGEVICGHD
ncbi:hypothetical protein EDD27_9090 [Nonomuraea polychroma]|uniref:DUF3592 domain-containing protein n=1 Tax=Nonomuraea polychroma TaxID=46176 RepID=A0A438MJW8_9ACTN|nr:hypothetical protein [Nonomuraea polychroma]RVX46229.1 hypothetical protein EDD27_9090 [Nonomuraea polychroma]